MEGNDERESFSVEIEPKDRQNGYYVRKRTIVLVVVAAVILIILVGVVSAFLGPGKHAKGHKDRSKGKFRYSLGRRCQGGI